MESELIYNNITELTTPVGTYSVTSNSEVIAFSVMKNIFNLPSQITDKNGNVIGTIQAETNYSIVIDPRNLKLHTDYEIRFDSFTPCKWEHCASDEHTTCFDAVIDDYVVGIGAYDPNDSIKFEQAWEYSREKGYLMQNCVMEPAEYDESCFTKYTAYELDGYNGYRFRLFDYSMKNILSEVAWIQINQYPVEEYEGAIGFWLC